MTDTQSRQAAIGKVSSHEELDRLMTVTSPKGWLALLTVFVLVVAVGLWSGLCTIPDLVEGRGALVRGDRKYDTPATMSGIVTALTVKPGDRVRAGQTVASLRREDPTPEQRAADAVTIAKDNAILVRLRAQLKTLHQQWEMEKLLVDAGVKGPKDMLTIERDMDSVRGQIDSLTAEIDRIRIGARATTNVKSAKAGQVVEVLKSVGDMVQEHEPLIRVEQAGEEVESAICGGGVHALLYVSASIVGKIRVGQFVRVSPLDVKKEEYGFIVGSVGWVATYPASTPDMAEKLKNDQLVKEFMSNGPAFELRVCLQADPANSRNPFKWSSSQGPPTRTAAGTICTASITVAERRPYSYVVPWVHRTVGF